MRRYIAWRMLLLLAAITVGCDSRNSGASGGKPSTSESVRKERGTESATSPLSSDSSRFLEAIGKSSYQTTETAGPADVRFDFSDSKVYAYDYTQIIDAASVFEGAHSPIKQGVSGSGILLIRSNGDRTGTLVLQDFVTTIRSGIDESTASSAPSTLVVSTVKEDGSVPGSSAHPLLSILFPIPSRSLSKGESAKVTFQVPFYSSTTGTVHYVAVNSTITLTRFVLVDGRRCAELDVDFESGATSGGVKLDCVVRGKGIYYYDMVSMDFVYGENATIVIVRAYPGQDPSSVVMKSDNLIRIRRNAEKAESDSSRNRK